MPIKKNKDSPASVAQRIQELQNKIRDEKYVYNAIDTIASVVSRHIVEGRSYSGKNSEMLIQ